MGPIEVVHHVPEVDGLNCGVMFFELHVMEELFEHVSGILINLIMVIHTEK